MNQDTPYRVRMQVPAHYSVDKDVNIERGARLRGFLIGQYGTLTKAAEALEMGKNQLSFYVTGQRLPGGDILTKLHDVARLNINWYLTGEGEMHAVKIQPASEMTPTDLSGLQRARIKAKFIDRFEDLLNDMFEEKGGESEREATRDD